MVDDSPPQKNDEQHPLLKVETGGGDKARTPPSMVALGCNVTCSPKRSWMERWPELVSTFWLSGMLLGIFCLILYGLGLGVVRRQPILMLHCNSSRPGSEVYYHHIVQRGNAVPFSEFSEYLSTVASLYSSLQLNIVFLMDDTLQTNYRNSRHTRFFNKQFFSNIRDYKFDENNQQEFRDFQLKYKNVNITVIPLSKYMAMTPLRYKWRTIPKAYLTFYARVFSVWQTGGIGMDLNLFSTQYNRRQLPDRRISAILKQHNNGIKPEEYTNILNNIDQEEQHEFISLFYGIFHQILNETRAFFNRTLLFSQDSMEKETTESEQLIRTHRNKRELIRNIPLNNSRNSENNNTTEEIRIINSTEATVVAQVYKNTVETNSNATIDKELNRIVVSISNTLKHQNMSQIKQNKTRSEFSHKNMTEAPQILLLYDFSLFSDNNKGPSYLLPEALIQSNLPELPMVEHATGYVNHSKGSSHILSVNLEGTFIAASLKEHPLLAHIISAGCQRMSPKFAIQDALISHCSNMLRDDFYCNNIYLL